MTGIAEAGFRSAAYFYFAGRQMLIELAGGADEATARATVMARCKATEAQLDYIGRFLTRRPA